MLKIYLPMFDLSVDVNQTEGIFRGMSHTGSREPSNTNRSNTMKLSGTKRISLTVNGVRVPVTVSNGPWVPQVPAEQVQIRAKSGAFPQAVREAFEVENDSDSREDYFEADRIRLMPGDDLYAQALKACS